MLVANCTNIFHQMILGVFKHVIFNLGFLSYIKFKELYHANQKTLMGCVVNFVKKRIDVDLNSFHKGRWIIQEEMGVYI